MADDDEALTPKQARIRTEFLAVGLDRPLYDPELAPRLASMLDRELANVSMLDSPDDPLVLAKFKLEQLHRCEGEWFHGQGPADFAWSVPKLRGTVIHRAIERIINQRYRPEPHELLESVIATMEENDVPRGCRAFLAELSDDDRSDLVGASFDGLQKFLADWPPVDVRWSPRCESRRWVKVTDRESIVLSAKYDLALGSPKGGRSRTMIVDIKSGSSYATHHDELRFYALVETLAAEVPPFRVGAYYTDSGSTWFEEVTEEGLYLAAERVIEAVLRMGEIGHADDPDLRLTPNPLCESCAGYLGCPVGPEYIAHRGY